MSWPWGIPFLAFGGALWKLLWLPRWRLQSWHQIVTACDLRVVEVSSFLARRVILVAEAAPLEVRIDGSRNRAYDTHIVVAVSGPPGFASVKIRRELRRPGAREIEIGDESFDRTFSVEGPRRLVSALLDVEVRRLLTSVNAECTLEIANRELRAELLETRVPRVLPLLVDLGRRFAQPRDVERCLAENARRDPEVGVRRWNLLLLARELPGNPRTLEALRAACSDASPRVRLAAATELRAEGRGVLVELAESTEDDACSAEALRTVSRELPFERTAEILTQALRRRLIQTAHAGLEALGRSGDAAAVGVLAKVMALEKGELAAAAAQALGVTHSADAEPPLILALGRDVAELRIAAARALSRVGSVAAVLPLKEAAATFSHDSDLGRVTRQAIAEIQSRLPGASPGELSLASAEAGQLSLAQAEAGQLSLARTEAGQLSLADDPAGQLSQPPENVRGVDDP